MFEKHKRNFIFFFQLREPINTVNYNNYGSVIHQQFFKMIFQKQNF